MTEHLYRTNDRARIRAVVAHPDVWPHVADDCSGAAGEFHPPIAEHLVYLMPADDAACFLLHPHNAILWEVHSAVLPEHRSRSKALAEAVIAWARGRGVRSLVTYVPKGNERAAHLACSVGFHRIGDVPASFLRDGVAIAQTILALEIN